LVDVGELSRILFGKTVVRELDDRNKSGIIAGGSGGLLREDEIVFFREINRSGGVIVKGSKGNRVCRSGDFVGTDIKERTSGKVGGIILIGSGLIIDGNELTNKAVDSDLLV
jgi:hypothetical protein